LTPTSRATNQINITGQADWSNLKAIAGDLKIQADSIDTTPYYEMFAATSTNQPAKASTPSAATNATAVAGNEEPDPVNLPIGKLNVGLNVGRFYFKQIEITNWVATTKIDGSHIVLNPFQFYFNGAPINSTVDADLGVKGYKYEVALKIDKLSLEPIVVSFMPEKAGSIKGLLISDISIKGAGIKDPDLTRNLIGQIAVSVTNAVVQITNSSWLSGVMLPVATSLKVPELMSDPLNSISCRVSAGQGKATVETLNFKSAAFIADIHGDMQFANPVTATPLDLPMTLSIKKSYVQNIPFFAGLAETNADYVALPLDVVKVSGTLGSPKSSINLKITTKNVTTILKGVENQVGDQKTKSILNNINSAIGGSQSQSGTTNTTTTNKPAAESVNKLLNGLFNKNK
jgi:hypothetical protein